MDKKVRPLYRALDENDTVEFSLTTSVRRTGMGEVWVKYAATGHVRPNETATETADRIAGFVTEKVTEYVNELMR